MISLIVAIDKNRVIGKDNRLPWRLPADLAYFKKVTLGSTVVMGHKTFESIGKPLPGRQSCIITRDINYVMEGCSVCHSIEDVLKSYHGEEVFIIGGEQVYSAFFPYADKLYITFIDDCFEGDAFFPTIDGQEWKLVSKVKGEKDENNPYDYYFIIYERNTSD